jgi:proline iminopeptidase
LPAPNPNSPGSLVPPTADQDALLPQVDLTIAGHVRAVHLEAFGDPADPVILVLHGSASDYRSYLGLKTLTDRYRVVFWDQRGSGLSERITREEITWDAAVAEIDAIKQLYSPAAPVTLISHSWGGMYAALYLGRYPERVDQVVFIEPGPGLKDDIFTANMNEMFIFNIADIVANEQQLLGHFLSSWDHAQLDYRYRLVHDSKMTQYYPDPGNRVDLPVWRVGAYVEYIRQNALMGSGLQFNYDFTDGLDTFPRQVLILGGSGSSLGYDFQERYHKPLFSDARVEEIEGTGHRMLLEKPDDVLNVIRDYLSLY